MIEDIIKGFKRIYHFIAPKTTRLPLLYLFLNTGIILTIIILFRLSEYEYGLTRIVLYISLIAINVFFLGFSLSTSKRRIPLNLIAPSLYLVGSLVFVVKGLILWVMIPFLLYSLFILWYSTRGEKPSQTITETKVRLQKKENICECGNKLTNEDVFCPECGKKVE